MKGKMGEKMGMDDKKKMGKGKMKSKAKGKMSAKEMMTDCMKEHMM